MLTHNQRAENVLRRMKLNPWGARIKMIVAETYPKELVAAARRAVDHATEAAFSENLPWLDDLREALEVYESDPPVIELAPLEEAEALDEARALLDRWQLDAEPYAKRHGGNVTFGGGRDDLIKAIAEALLASVESGRPVRR